MHKVKIADNVFWAQEGELLSSFLIRNGLYVDHPCGGNGICQKCLVSVNGADELSCRYKIKSDISVTLPEFRQPYAKTEMKESGDAISDICFALDIGTTTLALAMVSLAEKKIIRAVTHVNPQRAFGADVISRIEYCRNNGTDELQSVLIAEINSMLREIGSVHANKLYATGNTTMLHLFLGVDCSSMGFAPYTPAFIKSRCVSAGELGLDFVDSVETLPSVAAFVGADIVAGLNFVDMPANGKFNILVDLGTNAEVVLFSSTSALCTSAAAGPCFEGAGISCGMSAVKGAIYAYENDGAKTIGGGSAKGICGTGLVDIIAYIINSNIIDKTGAMEGESFTVAEGVYLTRQDVRQFQLAKSAVYSGIATLMKIKGITFDDVDALYISGGFSYAFNVCSAVTAGLIPKELKSRCVSVFNSSLQGTVRYACGQNPFSLYNMHIHYINLAENPLFKDLFITNLDF